MTTRTTGASAGMWSAAVGVAICGRGGFIAASPARTRWSWLIPVRAEVLTQPGADRPRRVSRLRNGPAAGPTGAGLERREVDVATGVSGLAMAGRAAHRDSPISAA